MLDLAGASLLAVPYWLLAAVGSALLLGTTICFIIVRPLHELSRALERFGEGQTNTRMGPSGTLDFLKIGARFNEMAERIEALVKSERDLLGDVSGELRASLERLTFAMEAAKKDQNWESAARRATREVDRLSVLASALSEVNRAEGDPASRGADVVPLGELLVQVADDCASEACSQQCGIALEIEAPATLRGNGDLLRSGLESVLRNAIRCSPKLCMIEMRLRRREGQAEVVVRDFGPSVPQEALDHLFDPVRRGDGAGNAIAGGRSRLPMATRAVAVHRGKLTARNTHPGLAVTIELPLAAV